MPPSWLTSETVVRLLWANYNVKKKKNVFDIVVLTLLQYGLAFYLQYLAHWPEYFQVIESPTGQIMGYSMYLPKCLVHVIS